MSILCSCSQCDIAALDTESYTPLMIAASEGHQEAFNVLLRRGADIDDQNEDGKTIVHLVAEENHCSVLKVCAQAEPLVRQLQLVLYGT